MKEAMMRPEGTLKQFLDELSALSRKHGIGIQEGATLFVMDTDDYGLSYVADADSNLQLVG